MKSKIFNFFIYIFQQIKKKIAKKTQNENIEKVIIEEKKQQRKLHFIFVTRCYKTTNLNKIKQNLKQVFSNQEEYNYKHLIIIDADRVKNIDDFQNLKDEHTSLFFFFNKKENDNFIVEGIDKALEDINKKGYVYILDDDNLVKSDFLDMVKQINYDIDDAVFFKVQGSNWDWNGQQSAKGHMDWACFITKLSIMKQLKLYNEKQFSSVDCDGVFFDRLISLNYHIKKINKDYGLYNVLPKP